MEGLFNLVTFFVMIAMAFFVGTAVEKAHYSSIEKQEKEMLDLPVVTFDNLDEGDVIEKSELIYGSVVISLDYFKRFLAGLRNIFGGRVSSYETLLDRGRREAILRMKKKARDAEFNMIVNMRFETSSIGQVTKKNGSLGCFEVMAYGTAIRMKAQ